MSMVKYVNLILLYIYRLLRIALKCLFFVLSILISHTYLYIYLSDIIWFTCPQSALNLSSFSVNSSYPTIDFKIVFAISSTIGKIINYNYELLASMLFSALYESSNLKIISRS